MAYSQPGIFNVLDQGIYPGTLGDPTSNTSLLQQLIYTVQGLGGGTILFPSQYEFNGINYTEYRFNSTIGVGPTTSPSPVSIIFAGTGQGTESQTTLIMEADGDLFDVDTGSPEQDEPPVGGEHVGGITFQDLSIKYPAGSSGTAINVVTGENVRVLRVVFIDCPQAVWFQDALQCSMFLCTAANNNTKPSPACVSIGTTENILAKEIYIGSCTLAAYHLGGTGILMQGTEHVRVMNVRMEGFSDAIRITPGGGSISGGQNAVKHYFGNVTVFTDDPLGGTGPAVTIQPQGQQSISEIVFSGCTFEPSAGAVSAGPGVYIDEGAYGAIVSDIRFISCHVTRWSGPGIEITSGTNIEINGGLYAANASGANPSGGSGGISITGPASAVRIVGAACIGTYPYIQNVGEAEHPDKQDVGIYIAGAGASNIIIDHCDLTGNSQYGAYISGTPGDVATNVFLRSCNVAGYSSYSAAVQVVQNSVYNVHITDCAGYNDQGVVVTRIAPASGVIFNGAKFGYYGPVLFTVIGTPNSVISQIQINANATQLITGSFTIPPGVTPDASITYSGGPMFTPLFAMFGQ